DRVVDRITKWGVEGGYFTTERDAEIFNHELKYLMVHQHASFNSPVWFNIGVEGVPQQASACFILSVDDDMHSILDWFKNEGIIFKGGSGSGINISKIRSSKEQLSGGGYASGPVSFMRGADSVAGSIKSGGTTRRAAKMVVLDADHPDVREFVWCKAKEEKKAWALGEAGYDMSLNGEAWQSIQFQNANNSVRATDDFMRKALAGEEWPLTARVDGTPVETLNARGLLREIAEAAWECGDPGMQFDTTINDWHTCPASGRINGSNPCFPGDARLHTTFGLLPIAELFERTKAGEDIRVYTHHATAERAGVGVVASLPIAVMRNGTSTVVRLRFANGAELRCTPNHRIWTLNRGYVAAEELGGDDLVMLNDAATPASQASWELPVAVTAKVKTARRGGHVTTRDLPDRWSTELGELLGHLTGDGCLTEDSTVWVDGLGRSAVREFLGELGVTTDHAAAKRVPKAIFTAPTEIQAAYLRGLFGSDGCVSRVEGRKASGYVGLGSHSEGLLKDVQRPRDVRGVRRIHFAAQAGRPAGAHRDDHALRDQAGDALGVPRVRRSGG